MYLGSEASGPLWRELLTFPSASTSLLHCVMSGVSAINPEWVEGKKPQWHYRRGTTTFGVPVVSVGDISDPLRSDRLDIWWISLLQTLKVLGLGKSLIFNRKWLIRGELGALVRQLRVTNVGCQTWIRLRDSLVPLCCSSFWGLIAPRPVSHRTTAIAAGERDWKAKGLRSSTQLFMAEGFGQKTYES